MTAFEGTFYESSGSRSRKTLDGLRSSLPISYEIGYEILTIETDNQKLLLAVAFFNVFDVFFDVLIRSDAAGGTSGFEFQFKLLNFALYQPLF